MQLTQLLFAAAVLAASSGPSDSVTEPAFEPISRNTQLSVETGTLRGFVELYHGETRLLVEGEEILLSGSTDLVIPLGGREIVVAGRFITGGWFWVETVTALSESRPALAPHREGAPTALASPETIS